MIGYRTAVVVLLAMFTACVTCSILFPIFRTTVTDTSGSETYITYYYWYLEESVRAPTGMWTVHRIYTRDIACQQMHDYYIWASSLSVASAGLGGLATLLGAAWISVGYSAGLSSLIFVLTFISFACSGSVVGLMAYAYCNDFCASSRTSAARAPQAAGFNIVEGYILLCVAVGGFAVLLLTQAIGFCCGCQTGKRPVRAAQRANEPSHEPVEPRPRRQEPRVTREARQQPRVVVAEDAERVLGQQQQQQRRTPDSTEGLYPYPQKH